MGRVRRLGQVRLAMAYDQVTAFGILLGQRGLLVRITARAVTQAIKKIARHRVKWIPDGPVKYRLAMTAAFSLAAGIWPAPVSWKEHSFCDSLFCGHETHLAKRFFDSLVKWSHK